MRNWTSFLSSFFFTAIRGNERNQNKGIEIFIVHSLIINLFSRYINFSRRFGKTEERTGVKRERRGLFSLSLSSFCRRDSRKNKSNGGVDDTSVVKRRDEKREREREVRDRNSGHAIKLKGIACATLILRKNTK